ncbi:MAG: aldehyde dehydrogenase family protein [Mariprofundales bacterium]
MSTTSFLEVRAPFTGEVLETLATANAVMVEQALSDAAELFADRQQWLTITERIAILERAVALMQQDAEYLAVEAAREGGKPLADSRIEMTRCIDSVSLCVQTLRSGRSSAPTMGINAASQHRACIMRQEPIGVVVAVSAFNHPLNLIAHQVAPAIATGCPVIVKPAQDTPLSCLRLVQIFHKAGLPEAWCQCIIPESRELSQALVTDKRVAFFSFIGSAKVGWYLRSQLAAGTRCALEHGGIAPVIIAEDADLDAAFAGLMKGSFYHAGQVCVSVQRIFAHIDIARPLAERLAKAASLLRVGNPVHEDTDIGPLIRAGEVERVHRWVQEDITTGAELLCGGHSLPNQCYAPTVLYDPPADSHVSTQEVFGPVVAVYPFSDIDEVINMANSLDVAFQASVYTQNINTSIYVAEKLAASAVMINDHTAFRVDWMPFAGLRHSGLGVGGIPYTMHDMQIEKMIVLHSKALA